MPFDFAPKIDPRIQQAQAAIQSGAPIPQRLMQDLSRDFNLQPYQAAGFVGNLATETGNFKHMQELKPLVEGSRGGYGYAQWTGPRRRAFEQWTKEQGLDPKSYEANYGFLRHELQNTPEGAVLGQLRQAQTPAQAAEIVSNKFLRPGIPHLENRINYANQFAQGQFDGAGTVSGGGMGIPDDVFAAALQRARGAVGAMPQVPMSPQDMTTQDKFATAANLIGNLTTRGRL